MMSVVEQTLANGQTQPPKWLNLPRAGEFVEINTDAATSFFCFAAEFTGIDRVEPSTLLYLCTLYILAIVDSTIAIKISCDMVAGVILWSALS